jgi:hypothetical protein
LCAYQYHKRLFPSKALMPRPAITNRKAGMNNTGMCHLAQQSLPFGT